MIKNREPLMEETVQKHIQNLDTKSPNAFKLGCKIGGEIVIMSLFGERFSHISFGLKTPY